MNNLQTLKTKIETISNNYKEETTGGFITGDGPIPSDIMFVGEAPGKSEVESGKPFVGVAGKNFEKYLNSIGIERKNIRITNTCFFRPIKIKTSKTGKTTISNRPPKVSEVNLFKEILDEEISLTKPKIIITLGNVPLKRLTTFKAIGECHGTSIHSDEFNCTIFPMYHPSSLTYNRNDDFKKMYEEDWLKLKDTLQKVL
ncbi:uracil-DNA glycosylase [Clostridium felsineum]|uniref:uracil-DNA glycosylase n=1 Tax=Clostridium felsineum TaxID=36839 RepID=UPI00098C443F|nr:uracil-DNA glycosylase [Clostridium felsineum]MCR3759707.1 uracil-DNA glycosylase [Clostridium felsineum]URZ18298.1 Type-4 uracil-DNA glycosylase [Clostridium felsineum DSM 794]